MIVDEDISLPPIPPVPVTGTVVHLRAGGTSVVLDLRGDDLPRVVHWGAELGDLDAAAAADLADAQRPQRITGSLDRPGVLTLVPEAARGWFGTPGVTGSRRGGADFSPALRVRSATLATHGDGGHALAVVASDDDAGLALDVDLELAPTGLLRTRARLRNTGADDYALDGVLLALPVPDLATELLDTTGRHLRERSPQRRSFTVGTHLRESRRGRPGADASLLLVAGEQGFGSRTGRVWGVHVGWSGNHRMLAERVITGEQVLAGGELLLPDEVVLTPGATYETPWLYGSHGTGLDELAGRFHDWLRARPQHPRRPRPVTLNTWEAVFFDHDLDRLRALADAGARIGAERFVLDDGWFGSRRDDTSGLGDWYVSDEVWPDGLAPLIDHVTGLGMEFGLWVEPEMVNPDSDAVRAHPDWVLRLPHRTPLPARQQQVLDLGHPDAWAYLLERLDALLTEHDIAYLKWDHNRDLLEPGHGPRGVPGVHRQTHALYALLDELRARHPGVEVESCASGGARVDLGILQRTERVWTSDCIDPLERVQIQRWTGLLVPPEMLGMHVGAPVSHATGRTHTLGFRAATAFTGHLGVEWDVTRATDDERAELARWVAAHKDLRALLHSGRQVHADHHDPALDVHGVVAHGGGRAVYVVTQLATSVTYPTGNLRLPGLVPDASYDVRPLPPGDVVEGLGQSPLGWWATGVRTTGRALAEAGLRAPVLHPERSVLVEVRRVAGSAVQERAQG